MSLQAGTRLGPYEILSPLGAGGMGEVYRARDGQLGRDVAIKVLPDAVAQDAERLARFQREAQVLASLNHPHIGAIYGLENSGTVQALVLELVEGETLADRIAAGPIPIDEALPMARQIADALEAAHERGIVHRDLKPANVKWTPGGQIKVLDFGLAKAVSGDGSSPDVTSSPTLTARSTQAGVILGSAAYMSPEQARGKPVDKRADIWAFGALLYEMLSGRRAFDGETVSDTLAAVLRAEPDWSALPADTPANVRKVLKRCLERDRARRLHDIADAKLDLDEVPEPATAIASMPAREHGRPRAGLPTVLAVVFALLAGVGWWIALRPNAKPVLAPTALAVALSESDQIPFDDSPVLDLSRDGRQLVFVSDRDGTRRLLVRSLDRVDARPLAGTERAFSPFFSPDGQWIGFFADGKLKKVPAAGGVALVLADAPNTRGGVWLSDDSIVYAPDFTSGLMRVAAAGGGKPEVLTTPDTAGGERTHRWPTYLPGDASVLFTIGTLKNPGSYDDARIAVFDVKTRKVRVVFSGGSMARYAPTGHLLYVRSQSLMAVPFDSRRREIVGDPVALSDRASGDPSSGVVYAAVGMDGTLAYVPGADMSAGGVLVMVDRSGKPKAMAFPPRPYHYPRFSPDGKQVAVTIGLGHGHSDEVWVCDIPSGALKRLTFGDANGNYSPVWSPDGRRIAYSSDREHQGVYLKNSDGTGNEEALQPNARPDLPTDWSHDGSMLAIGKSFPTTDLWTVSLADRKETLFERNAAGSVFSPNGRWIAYAALPTSDSPAQVLVRPVAVGGGKIQITSDQGAYPVWTDKEIIFVSDKTLVAIEAQTEPTFHTGTRRELFESPYETGTMPLRNYDVTRDGQTFVFVRDVSGRSRKVVNVVLNWASGLAREAQAKR